jgi:hypothetical protein
MLLLNSKCLSSRMTLFRVRLTSALYSNLNPACQTQSTREMKNRRTSSKMIAADFRKRIMLLEKMDGMHLREGSWIAERLSTPSVMRSTLRRGRRLSSLSSCQCCSLVSAISVSTSVSRMEAFLPSKRLTRSSDLINLIS